MLNVIIKVMRETIIAVNMNGVLVLVSFIFGIAQSVYHRAVNTPVLKDISFTTKLGNSQRRTPMGDRKC